MNNRKSNSTQLKRILVPLGQWRNHTFSVLKPIFTSGSRVDDRAEREVGVLVAFGQVSFHGVSDGGNGVAVELHAVRQAGPLVRVQGLVLGGEEVLDETVGAGDVKLGEGD